jgi:hypothetical protein
MHRSILFFLSILSLFFPLAAYSVTVDINVAEDIYVPLNRICNKVTAAINVTEGYFVLSGLPEDCQKISVTDSWAYSLSSSRSNAKNISNVFELVGNDFEKVSKSMIVYTVSVIPELLDRLRKERNLGLRFTIQAFNETDQTFFAECPFSLSCRDDNSICKKRFIEMEVER